MDMATTTKSPYPFFLVGMVRRAGVRARASLGYSKSKGEMRGFFPFDYAQDQNDELSGGDANDKPQG
jgi:hypothetical protein